MEINGKPVVDATKSTRIRITKRDTKEGANKNPSECAAARAVKRDIPECLSARVHIGRVYVETDKFWLRYYTPDPLRTEVVAYDRGGEFAPGYYTLKAPSGCERIDARRKKARSGSNTNRNRMGPSPTKGPRKVHVAIVKRHAVSGIRPKGANR